MADQLTCIIVEMSREAHDTAGEAPALPEPHGEIFGALQMSLGVAHLRLAGFSRSQ